ncbi:ISKra4 family transposase [Archangium sp.]|uniref:ISKra4 family transposase n=1 Tax=Archangium sp. TaxID=1872627 RepID=UPI002D3FB6A1|nr:ISKra4 family transposase [Archangium sp.]HYO51887.1 ISKra4 family transposase [Archangium sp.]
MPTSKADLSSLSTQELLEEFAAELARRGAAEAPAEDMSTMELALEAQAEALKSASLARRLERRSGEEDDNPKQCPRCGEQVPVKVKKRPRQVRTLSGLQVLRRNYHYCKDCQAGFYPLDAALGMPEGGEVTQEVERRILDFGVSDTFNEAAQRWEVHYGWTISENLVRRVVERVGRMQEECEPEVLQEELQPVLRQAPALVVLGTDGSMIPTRGEDTWREAKVAVVSREEVVAAGRESPSVREQARYVAVVGSPEELKGELAAALKAHGANEARRVVCLGDGAAWVWNLAEQLCPQAIQVLDWRHAQHYVVECGKALFGEDDACLGVWRDTAEKLLWQGETEVLQRELEACLFLCGTDKEKKAIVTLKRYCSNNAQRMQYATFREAGLPVGSGIVESAHRHVLQQRMKRAGQHWVPQRAHRMARLRAAYRTAGPKHFHGAIYAAAARSAASST